MKDYYAILGVPRNATAKAIRSRWLAVAKRLHPDTNAHPDAGRALAQVNEAYVVLRDAKKRRAYDLQFNVRQFVPKAGPGGALDILGALQTVAAGKVPQQFVDALSPVVERKLGEHGINARAATAEDVMQALGWLKPKGKRRKRA